MNRGIERFAPLTGVVGIILVIVGFLVQGQGPGVDASAREVVDFYTSNGTAVMIGAMIVVLGAVFLVYFGATLRKALAAASGEGAMLPGVALAGFAILATGMAIDSTILFAAADGAGDIPSSSLQTLNALYSDDFLPLVLGTLIYLSASGIAAVRTGALPKWLGWVAIALCVIAATPAGFVAFIGSAVWVLIVSITLFRRGSVTPTPSA